MSEHFRYHSGKRILLFLIILLISSLIGVAISAAFMFAGDTGMKIAQGLSSIMMFGFCDNVLNMCLSYSSWVAP